VNVPAGSANKVKGKPSKAAAKPAPKSTGKKSADTQKKK
jgi:hypothetical protein